jgi:5-methylthioribose kinase
MPRLLGSDPASRVIALEDLGEAKDFTPLYTEQKLTREELDSLVAYLEALHAAWDSPLPPVFANREMRALNHEHIFRLPLASDNGLDLDAFTTGLQEASKALMEDRDYVDGVTKLGETYLADDGRRVIVHGDYFPGSWLRTARGIRIIDPEFCFAGPAAFDVGVMLGHLYLAGQTCVEDVLELYSGNDEDTALARQFAGVEIMRRLIGVAQLPLSYGIERKRALLELSRELVLSA